MVIHRRNNAAAAIVLLLAAVLIAAATQVPLVLFIGPDLSVAQDAVSLGFTPGLEVNATDVTGSALLTAAAFIALLALALLITRIRGLGVLWRLGALVILALPVLLGLGMWQQVKDGPAEALRSPDAAIGERLLGFAASVAQDLGFYSFEPGMGLWMLSAGAVLGVLGVLIPAARSERWVGPPAGYGTPPQQLDTPRRGT